MRLLVKEAVGGLAGDVVVPNSKYHAHRALILASLAPGRSRIDGLSDAGHVRHTLQALAALGVRVDVDGHAFVVHGGGYHPERSQVPVGSSGSTLYFLTGLTSLADRPVTVVGQKYLQRRPIRPLLGALQGLGVQLSAPTGRPPIAVRPHRPAGGRVSISGTLSQWISGLLLLAPFATGPSEIVVDGELNERSYIDLTIAMMADFGLHVEVRPGYRAFRIDGNQTPHPADLTLPPDVGSAAFGLAVTALHPSDVLFHGLHTLTASETDHPEAALLDVVTQMGLPMVRDPATGDVRVRHDGIRLSGVRVDCRDAPDILPILATLGTFAAGETVLEHVAHVRLKESDRVSAMLQLNRMGGRLELRDDQLVCTGVPRLVGADLSSFNDHRVLMSLAVAASRAEGETRLTYPHAYRISYPRFLDAMNTMGVPMSVESAVPARIPARGPATGRTPSRLVPGRLAARNMSEVVRRWARRRPTGLAVAEVGAAAGADRTWTWAELDAAADRVALALLDLGVQPGEPVAYQLPNVGEFVVLTLATIRIGAVCCPLMPIYREREVAHMLGRSRARVLVVPDTFRGRDYPAEVAALLAGPAGTGLAVDHVLVLGAGAAGAVSAGQAATAGLSRGTVEWADYADAVADREVDDAARARLAGRRAGPGVTAQLLFTSGTSGEPKGVLHRMDALNRAAAMEVNHLGLSADDRIYIPSPLAHQTGFLYGMWLAFALGSPQILQPVWDPATAVRAINAYRGSFVQAATPFLSDLVKTVEANGTAVPTLRIFVATGAAVPRGLAERATRVLGAAVCGAWGTTETCLGSLAAPDDEPVKVWGTDGRALTGVRIRVTDDAGNVLGPGQEGNFEVTSKCLFQGYLDRPDWTAEAMTPDGWYRSGDLAVIDESGFVRISGRVKDVVNRGGEKVPVAEIEQLLHEHPAVEEVAIVAMPDPRLGERACAFAVVTGALDLDGMRRYLDGKHVAKQYWPERLEIIDVLPRNATGKIQKFLLRERARHLAPDPADSPTAHPTEQKDPA